MQIGGPGPVPAGEAGSQVMPVEFIGIAHTSDYSETNARSGPVVQPGYLRDWNPVDVQIVKDAFAEWQHAMNNRLMFIFMNDPTNADVTVNWWDTTQPSVENTDWYM